ncbi:hypothetical protein ACFFX0_31245 [Citricoccus parietis]|uniref:Uncharacterized protein n=1 Tax=Citricoccus parietis TaxID=592307 RepID=A0ABV5G8X8_9MICC
MCGSTCAGVVKHFGAGPPRRAWPSMTGRAPGPRTGRIRTGAGEPASRNWTDSSKNTSAARTPAGRMTPGRLVPSGPWPIG